jgi:phospholipid/cholesterol/gamma-HCH transport system substrate-binding protein
MAGYDIGRVEKIGLDTTNNKVLIRLKLKWDAPVKSDSVASIKFTGLMGQNFVSVDFGSLTAPVLENGQYLTTKESTDMSAMMQKIDNVASGMENLTKSWTGDKIDNLLGPLMDFVKKSKDPLTSAISNFNIVSRDLAEGKGTVGRLIKEDTLYRSALTTVTNLQDTATEIRTTVADARKIVDQINAGQGTVGKLIKDETLYREATTSMTQLREIMQKINQGQGTIGKVVNDQELYNNAKLTLQKLDKATEGLEDQGPLSVMGILVNNLF